MRSVLEERGLESIFRIEKEPENETYLLESWGEVDKDDVAEWVTKLKAEGVPKKDGSKLPVCEYDLTNLRWLAAAVRDSLNIKLWNSIEKDLGYDATGPEIFIAAVQQFQLTNAS